MSGTVESSRSPDTRDSAGETSSTVEKALQLIELVAERRRSLAELTSASGLSRSPTHRLASVLVKHRSQKHRDNQSSLGLRFLELGDRRRAELLFLRAAQPIARRYCEQTGETVHLAVLQGTDMQLMDKIVGKRQLQVNSFVGQTNRAYRTGVGKAMIATRPESEWQHFLTDLDDEGRARLLDDLTLTKARGYAIDIEESNIGVCCVAAAIRHTGERQLAAVSFNGPSVYLTPERIEALTPVLVECAREIEAAIRGQ